MKISFDPTKRALTRRHRGLDFARAGEVFAGRTATIVDDRFDYGETRFISAGHLDGRLVVMVWTQRGEARHIISMRHVMPTKKKSGSGAWVDRDDAPELTETFFDKAEIRQGDRLVRRGRPPLPNPKQAVKLRLDADVLSAYRKTGTGWQTRINADLRKARKLKAG
jgi:uncharacterized protein (DUF4415 family)